MNLEVPSDSLAGPATDSPGGAAALRELLSIFKLRIGLSIMLCGMAGIAVSAGPALAAWQAAAVSMAVLLSSAAAGAFNQYIERDLDARMARTRRRPFASGRFAPHWAWPTTSGLLLLVAVAAAAAATNAAAALFVFLGAFTYGFVYTVWLKRQTWMNIVWGGLAGSFAVLAGAAAVDPALGPAPLLLAGILFLWTPPHFWSLATAYRAQYAEAGVPMLPVVLGEQRTATVILVHTVVLVALSITPAAFGMGMVYLVGAAAGGARFLWTSARLARAPSRAAALSNFHASLLQLALLLGAAIIDAIAGHPGAGLP